MEKSKNSAVVIGTILETNIKYDPEQKNFFDESIKGAYVKKDFKNPAMLKVAVERELDGKKVTATVKVNMDNIFKVYKTKSGETKEVSTFKEIEKILNSPNEGVGLPIRISGSFDENKYSTDDYKISRSNIFKGQYIGLSNIDVADSKAEGELTGIIAGLGAETVGEDETGRLILNLYTIKYVSNGVPNVQLLNLIVPEQFADIFEREFSVGDAVCLDVEMKDVQHGNVETKTESRGFSDREVKTTSGYTATEFHVFNGWVLNEGESGYIDEEELATLKKAYQITCDSLIQKKKDKTNGAKTSSNKSISNRTVDNDVNNPFASEGGLLDIDEDVNPFNPFS
jgi:hypothetical protein